jgi:outer membrane protein OmpA-like peptidoglycan-associated protein
MIQPYRSTIMTTRLDLLFKNCWVFLLLSVPAWLPGQVRLLDTVFVERQAILYFDFGQSELTASADSSLVAAAEWFKDQPHPLQVLVEGHTDAVGDDSSNDHLSEKRAHRTRERLIQMGVPDSLIRILYFGESSPVHPNLTEEGRARNRRVTVEFIKRGRAIFIQGRLIDDQSRKGISGSIVATIKGLRDTLTTDSLGGFQVLLPDRGIVSLGGFALKYYFNSYLVKPAVSLPDSLVVIPLRQIHTGEVIQIEKLYFVSNTPILIESSKPELDKLVYFMRYNPGVSIEIDGHVNVPGNEQVSRNSWQYELSVLRARMVYNHLIKNGIPPFRLRYKGFGNWQMRYKNPSNSEEAQLNRRVEIRILNDGTLK